MELYTWIERRQRVKQGYKEFMFTRCKTVYYQEVFKYSSQGKWDLEDHNSNGLNCLYNLGTGLMSLNLDGRRK